MKTYNIDHNGFYGDFGGAFIPEMLYPNVIELKENYNKIINDHNFKRNLKNYSKIMLVDLLHFTLPKDCLKNLTLKCT